jgi:DNA-binding transcriptional ArsR family regulator
MMNIFDALADPTRRRILDLLREQPRPVNELADLLLITQPSASKHLRVLREAGLVNVRQEGQRHWYELRVEPLVELDAWLTSYRQAQDKHFDRLDAYLSTLQDSETDRKRID